MNENVREIVVDDDNMDIILSKRIPIEHIETD